MEVESLSYYYWPAGRGKDVVWLTGVESKRTMSDFYLPPGNFCFGIQVLNLVTVRKRGREECINLILSIFLIKTDNIPNV